MKRALGALAALGLLGLPVAAIWVGSEDVPVERLIENLRKRLQEQPDDAHRHYQLGRACGLAFVLRTPTLRSTPGMYLEPGQQADLEPLAIQQRSRGSSGPKGGELPLSSTEYLELLATAVREQRIAAQAGPSRAEYHLGLAYVLARGAHLASMLDSAPLLGAPTLDNLERSESVALDRKLEALVEATNAQTEIGADNAAWSETSVIAYLDSRRADPNPQVQRVVANQLRSVWLQRALDEYLSAYRLAWPRESALEVVHYHGDQDLGVRNLVAYEAGQAVLALSSRAELAGRVSDEQIQTLQASLAKLEALPGPTFITPIVLSFESRSSLSDLLTPERRVRFDLDGDGFAELRTWVQPRTGLLVWDPEGQGTITSGRQLFGDATWWMFFRDGYDALDALDDNRDGWLFGDELLGLALWRDADGDAISDPGEVEDLRCLGVVALATHADTLEGLSPGASRGAWLRDGRCLPTWDWVAEPVPEPPLASSPEANGVAKSPFQDEPATYEVREIEGWSVHVDSALLEPDSVGPDALELLAVKLFDVRRAVPPAALEKLRSIPIWLSAADSACTCACYHVSAEWLGSNGHDPAKARAVEITKADLFLDWSHEQPSMVLHELAHGWFDRELGGSDARLSAALERARASGLYDHVLRWSGAREKHYALGNETEFFAEMSESWLGTNDYWPFVRAELLDADPQTARLLQEIWGN